MFNRSQYIHKFFNPPKRIKDAISGSKNIRRVNTMLNIFQQEKIGDRWIEIRLDTPAFPCNKFRETGIRHLAFKMMLGPTNTSVILLEQVDRNNMPLAVAAANVFSSSSAPLNFSIKTPNPL